MVAVTSTDVSSGVTVSSVVASDASYSRNRPCGLVIVVPATGAQSDHATPSSEVRVSIPMLVPVGVAAVASRFNQVRPAPASIARDTNVHGERYGVICIQSTETSVLSMVKSLTNGRIGVVM